MRRLSEIREECRSILTEADKKLAIEARAGEIKGGYLLVYDSSSSKDTPGKLYRKMSEILEELCGIRIQRSVYWFPSLNAAEKFRDVNQTVFYQFSVAVADTDFSDARRLRYFLWSFVLTAEDRSNINCGGCNAYRTLSICEFLLLCLLYNLNGFRTDISSQPQARAESWDELNR